MPPVCDHHIPVGEWCDDCVDLAKREAALAAAKKMRDFIAADGGAVDHGRALTDEAIARIIGSGDSGGEGVSGSPGGAHHTAKEAEPPRPDSGAVTAYTAKRLADRRVLECLALVFWDMPESGLDEAVESLREMRDHWISIDNVKARPAPEHG